MSNIRVGVGKKGIVVALVIGILLLGGGGGYLLWRVNQEDTVAPTDSDASEENCVLRCTGSDCTPRDANGNCPEDKAGICYLAGYEQTQCCKYEKICNITAYHITYAAGANGSVSKAGKNSVAPGGSISSTATPNTGYKFVKWSDNKTTAARTDSNVRADATYTAEFQQIAGYTLEILVSPVGSGKVFDGDGADITGKKYVNLTPGSQIWNRAAPNSGYKFVKWLDGKTDNPRVELINSNMVLTATFEALPADKVTLTYVAGTGGTITGTATQTIDKGASGTAVTATPNTGYAFEKWSDNKTTAARTDTNVQASATYTATFKSTSPTAPVNCTGFTLSCGANNTININWNLVSGAVKYIARINKAPKSDWLNEAGGDVWISFADNVTSHVIQNAQSGVVYGVNVLAYSGPDGQKDFHPSCNLTSLGQIWDPPMYLEISCQGTTPVVDPGNGTVPDTGIFDNSKHTMIFGFVVLVIGLAWTWISTLPQKAFLAISSTSDKMREDSERKRVERRRSRLERRLK